MPDRPAFYRRPPIIERVASLYTQMDHEVFASRLSSWQEIVKAEYPVGEPIQNWIIRADDRDGVPIFDTLHPLLQIIPRYSRKSAKEGFDWSIRCPSGQFTMNMHSDPEEGETRRFDHLRKEFAIWIPLWISHFEVKEANRLTLHYVNALTPRTVPGFFDDQRHLFLSRVISVFADIPGEHDSIIQPYSCEVTLLLKGGHGATLKIKVNDWMSPRYGSGVEVSFIVSMPFFAGEVLSPERALELLDRAHEYIVQRFEVVFTQEARASFSPET
jgi:hypothetical protein